MIKIMFVFMVLSFSTFANNINVYEEKLEKIESKYEKSLNSELTTVGLVRALKVQYNEMDALLNESYNALFNSLNSEQQKALRDSQREWIKFRDKEMGFIETLYDKDDPTICNLNYLYNMTSLTKNRTIDIINHLENMKDY